MSAVLVGVKYKSDKRDQYLHHGGWLVKLTLWLVCCVLPFFFPVGLVNAYCEQGSNGAVPCNTAVTASGPALPCSLVMGPATGWMTVVPEPAWGFAAGLTQSKRHDVILQCTLYDPVPDPPVYPCSLGSTLRLWLIHGRADDHPGGHDAELERQLGR